LAIAKTVGAKKRWQDRGRTLFLSFGRAPSIGGNRPNPDAPWSVRFHDLAGLVRFAIRVGLVQTEN
jgi:hypothetical protein